MAVFKCKMCGGAFEVAEGSNIAECEFCGTQQTVPSLDDEKKIAVFSKANRLRFANEFDKAAGMYESIISDFPKKLKHTGAWFSVNMGSSMLTIH